MHPPGRGFGALAGTYTSRTLHRGAVGATASAADAVFDRRRRARAVASDPDYHQTLHDLRRANEQLLMIRAAAA
jgi:hypothetical protein